MTQSLDQALADFSPGLPFVVALSGGADSTALLCACAQRWPGQVRAVHVHHGLQAAADGFEAHCRQLCARLDVPLAVSHVDARAAAGQSPEDAARRARYAALTDAVQHHWPDAKAIALAQHADDQVETLLIALSRGAGLPGLAAMPAHWARAGMQWHRPLLQVAGVDLRQWLHDRGQSWVEDPTNTDLQFTRNRIRAEVMPALAQALPAFRDTFARSAAHAAQAQTLLDELAAEELTRTGCPPAIAALRALGPARQALVLRYWLKTQHQVAPSTAQLHELQDQLADCNTRGHRLHLKVGAGFVRRQGDVLSWQEA
ncbi:MAG: tRNA lysidine(34) synthetase TilS [Limnohabitans sp.]|jgi:tRNA(Ile)-lysidine synthase